ncbi:MAG: HPr family phosphocarrier protein [Lachnospiraceae bacterium]|nr:HPr family phosphocarrier protein [Lachnospiraceae bacterium]
MIEKVMQIQLPTGLEARPVAILVQVASRHECSVYIQAEGKKVNAKSIMGMMSLGLDSGETVTVIADGEGEQQAIADIEEYLSKGSVK